MVTREHILSEIRRTAASNGGVALGSRRFEVATGLKTSDWLGKFWARWNDALAEAGFTPNRLQGAYEARDLLDLYVSLARELARLPTANDLRLKATTEATFPNPKTFDRFGNKRELVRKAMEHARDRGGMDDVMVMCDEYIRRPEVARDTPNATAEMPGYVYLLQHGSRREYKIGRTSNALRREGQIAVELPERVQPVHVIATDDASGIEAYWHRRFAGKRKNGEWFDLSASDVAAFRRRKFM